jgi:hypothetical protein
VIWTTKRSCGVAAGEFGKTEGERNSLAGNNVSYVRAALNRMLGLTETPPKGPASDDDERAAASALDTGDEAGSKKDAVNRGFDPQDPQQSAKTAAGLARWRRENDAYAIACAVDDYSLCGFTLGPLMRLAALAVPVAISSNRARRRILEVEAVESLNRFQGFEYKFHASKCLILFCAQK